MAVSIAKLAIMLTTDTAGMQRGFAQGEGQAKTFQSRIAAIGGSMKEFLGGAMWGVAAAGMAKLAQVANGLLQESLGIAAAWERMDATFKVMLGNAEAASDLRIALSGIDKGLIADEDIQAAAKAMLSMGNSAAIVEDRIKRFADISIASGESVESLADSWLRFQADGKVSSSDLTRLMRAGVPVLEDLEHNFGLNRVAILAMADAGQITFTDMENSLKRLTDEGGRFSSAMEEAGKTLSGQFSGLKDDVAELAAMGFGFLMDDMAKLLGSEGGAGMVKDFRDQFLNIGGLENVTARNAKLEAGEREQRLMSEENAYNLMLKGMVEEHNEAMKKVEGTTKTTIQRIRSQNFAGLNPGADFYTSSGAAAMNAAKGEMQRMVVEQKNAVAELKSLNAKMAGVATF